MSTSAGASDSANASSSAAVAAAAPRRKRPLSLFYAPLDHRNIGSFRLLVETVLPVRYSEDIYRRLVSWSPSPFIKLGARGLQRSIHALPALAPGRPFRLSAPCPALLELCTLNFRWLACPAARRAPARSLQPTLTTSSSAASPPAWTSRRTRRASTSWSSACWRRTGIGASVRARSPQGGGDNATRGMMKSYGFLGRFLSRPE